MRECLVTSPRPRSRFDWHLNVFDLIIRQRTPARGNESGSHWCTRCRNAMSAFVCGFISWHLDGSLSRWCSYGIILFHRGATVAGKRVREIPATVSWITRGVNCPHRIPFAPVYVHPRTIALVNSPPSPLPSFLAGVLHSRRILPFLCRTTHRTFRVVDLLSDRSKTRILEDRRK